SVRPGVREPGGRAALAARQRRHPHRRRVGRLALAGALAAPPPAVQRAFMGFVSDIPHSLWPFWQAMVGLLAVFVLVLLVVVAVRGRWAVLRDIVLAGVVALGGAMLLARVVAGSWPAVWDSLRAAGDTS